jgi:hypothetical protein
MNKWDKEMTHVDVVDDYVSERNEIRRAKGQQFQFSQGQLQAKTRESFTARPMAAFSRSSSSRVPLLSPSLTLFR